MEDRRLEALAKERAWERGTEVKNQPFFGYPFPKRRSRKHTSGHKESPWTFLWTQLRDLKVLSPRLGEKLRGGAGSTDEQRTSCVGPVGERQSSLPSAAAARGATD